MVSLLDSEIVFVGQLPPPINGLTLITTQLLSALRASGHQIQSVSYTHLTLPTNREV